MPVDEALLLAGEVVADLSGRTYAALMGWRVPLPIWLQLQTAALGGKPSMPPLIEPQSARPSRADRDEGEAILARYSAIPNPDN